MTSPIHIYSHMNGISAVKKFYTHSPQEHFGTDFVKTGTIYTFDNFAKLAEQIAAHKSETHVIVCHGWVDTPPSDSIPPSTGLAMKFYGTVGLPMGPNFTVLMSELADYAEALRQKEKSLPSIDASSYGIGMKDSDFEHVAKACAKIKHNPRIIVRGCQLGKSSKSCNALGRALNGSGIDAPKLDQLFAAFVPRKANEDAIAREEASNNRSATLRKRLFKEADTSNYSAPTPNKFSAAVERKIAGAGTLLLQVEHDAEDVSTTCWATDPGKGSVWGDALNRLWIAPPSGPASQTFYAKMLWGEKDGIKFPIDSDYIGQHYTSGTL